MQSTSPDDFLIANMFHWFSVSLCNHLRCVRLAALIEEHNYDASDLSNQDNFDYINTECSSFVKSTIPAVMLWRHKIGAHVAATAPKKQDNQTTIKESLFTPVNLTSGRYFTKVGSYESDGLSGSIPSWSITKVYEELTERFWPERII